MKPRTRKWILLATCFFLLVGAWFQREYLRTMGHPFRWDIPTYGEYQHLANPAVVP